MANIETWAQRAESNGDWLAELAEGMGLREKYMLAEIANLRAALASSATTEPSDLTAAILALPLPTQSAWGFKSIYGHDPDDGSKQLIGVSVGRGGKDSQKIEVALFTAEQVRSLLSAAAALAAQVPAQEQAWISVTDNLPGNYISDDSPCKLDGREIPPAIQSKRVLVALSDGSVREDRMEGLQGNTPFWSAFRDRVTHWMPLPPAPAQLAQSADKAEE